MNYKNAGEYYGDIQKTTILFSKTQNDILNKNMINKSRLIRELTKNYIIKRGLK